MRTKVLNIGCWCCDIRFIAGGTEKQAAKKASEWLKHDFSSLPDPSNIAGMCYLRPYTGNRAVVYLSEGTGIGTLSHEISHAVSHILACKGALPVCADGMIFDEHQAYLLDYVIRWACGWLNEIGFYD